MKLTVSKSKNSASFYVQKTIRKSNGTVTTVTVEKLGNLTEALLKLVAKSLMFGLKSTLMNLIVKNMMK